MCLQVGRLARKELRLEELEHALLSSAERRGRGRAASEREGAVWEAIAIVADLIRRHNVRFSLNILLISLSLLMSTQIDEIV